MQQKMAASDRERLLEIRKRGAVGPVSLEDSWFCQQMFELFPKDYHEIEEEIQEYKQRLMNPMWRPR
jgi:hypothetical protein